MGKSWRLDETSVKIKGNWASLNRAVNQKGQTIDFFLPRSENVTPLKNSSATPLYSGSSGVDPGLGPPDGETDSSPDAGFPVLLGCVWYDRRDGSPARDPQRATERYRRSAPNACRTILFSNRVKHY